jgi:hypothetical protein
MTELKPCPFCGDQPNTSFYGSHIEISCCISMEIQKSNYLTIEQRETWNNNIYCYSDEAEEIAKNKIVSMWNTRHNYPTIKVDEEISYASLPKHLKDMLEIQQTVLDSQADKEFLANIRESELLYDDDLILSYQQNWDLYEEPYKKGIVGDTGQFLMLGRNGDPQLLAEIVSITDLNRFRFFVINGEWYGTYDNGTVTVEYTKKSMTGWEILSEDQTLFNGGGYNMTFERYHLAHPKQEK